MGRRARLHPLLARRWRLLHQRRQGGGSGAYATVGYGRQELSGSCPDFEGDPSWGGQSSLGFQPSNTTSIKAGQVFLVGMMRRVNRPIYSDTSVVTNPARPETAYYGSFNVRAAGTIEANFPWVEKDTINTCTGKIDSDGRLIVGDYGKEGDRVPTSCVYDSKGNVGHYGATTSICIRITVWCDSTDI